MLWPPIYQSIRNTVHKSITMWANTTGETGEMYLEKGFDRQWRMNEYESRHELRNKKEAMDFAKISSSVENGTLYPD